MTQNDGNGGENRESSGNTGGSAGDNQLSQQDLGEGGNENNQGLKRSVFITINGSLSDKRLLKWQGLETMAPVKSSKLPRPQPYLLKLAAGLARKPPLPSPSHRQRLPQALEGNAPLLLPHNILNLLSLE